MRKTDTADKLALMKAYMKTLDLEYTHVLLISGDKDFMNPINDMNNRLGIARKVTLMLAKIHDKNKDFRGEETWLWKKLKVGGLPLPFNKLG